MSSYSSDFGGGGYADFLEYMKLKNANIKLQLEERYDQTGKPQIFAGCIVGIDGRTVVLDALLKKLIYEHGGIYEYLDSRKFTHLIADNIALGNQKWRRILSGYKPPYRIVHSKWVTDSVKEGKRLNEGKYMPAALAEHWKIDNNALITGLVYKQPRQGGGGLEDHRDPPLAQIESKPPAMAAEVNEIIDRMGDGSPSAAEEAADEAPPSPPPPPPPLSPPLSAHSNSPPIISPPLVGERHSGRGGSRDIGPTRENPNFVRDYFAKSRLHFIGRWKENISAKHKFSSLTQHMQIPIHWILNGAPPGTRWHPAVRYLHVDFDSFFVAVGVKMSTESIPDPEALPIAIAHGSSEMNSTSEIASCNYKAREFGVTKGMYVGAAVQKCPQLKILSYHLDEIARCSNKLMAILALVTNRVSPTSCDEAYLQLVAEEEVGGGVVEDRGEVDRRDLLPSPQRKNSERQKTTSYGGLEHSIYIAAWIRQKVLSATDCSVSIGIGDSAFLAKMASKNAKPPNGIGIWAIPLPDVKKISSDAENRTCEDRFRDYVLACTKSVARNECPRKWQCQESRDLNYRLKLLQNYFLKIDLPSLHGVGIRTSQQLATMGLTKCQDIIVSEKNRREQILRELKQQLGDQRGESIFLLAHGIDNRSVSDRGGADVSTISVTVNWGVRLFDQSDVDDFFRQLGEEAFTRYHTTNVEPQTLNLKLLIRAPDHPKIPIKYGGCGVCIEFTESLGSRIVLKNPKDITNQALNLFHHLKENFEIEDIRGVTITLGKFQNLDRQQSRLKSFLHKKKDIVEPALAENVEGELPQKISPLQPESKKPKKGLLDNFLVTAAGGGPVRPAASTPAQPMEEKTKHREHAAGPLDQFLKVGGGHQIPDSPAHPHKISSVKSRKRKPEKAASAQIPAKRSNALLQFMHSAHVQRSHAGQPLLTIIDSSSEGEEFSPLPQPARDEAQAARDEAQAARDEASGEQEDAPQSVQSAYETKDHEAQPVVFISEDEVSSTSQDEKVLRRNREGSDNDTDPMTDLEDSPQVPDPQEQMADSEIEDDHQQPESHQQNLNLSAIEISSDPSIYSGSIDSASSKVSQEPASDALQKRLAKLERKLLYSLQTDPFRYLRLLRERDQLRVGEI